MPGGEEDALPGCELFKSDTRQTADIGFTSVPTSTIILSQELEKDPARRSHAYLIISTESPALGLSNSVPLAFQLIDAADNSALEVGCWKPTEANFHGFQLKLKLILTNLKLKLKSKLNNFHW